MNWNKMVRVFCPLFKGVVWANGLKESESSFRCTKCGEKHQKGRE
jgi:transposase-like protein